MRRVRVRRLSQAPVEERHRLRSHFLMDAGDLGSRNLTVTWVDVPPGASQRLALDVLIAVSARRWRAQVVTENWADFKAIQRYCNATIIKAAQFFNR